MQSLFNFLKRIFNWADETPRKRQAADDLSEIYYVAPKKHCIHRRLPSRMSYIDLEDDGDIEIISEHISPVVYPKMLNGTHNCTPKRKPSPALNNRKPRHYCELDSFERMASSSRMFRTPNTLQNTNAMLDKKKYSDMLQHFMPEKDKHSHILFQEIEKEPVQEVEIIELDKPDEPGYRVPKRVGISKIPVKIDKQITARNSRQPTVTIQLDDDEVSSSERIRKQVCTPPIGNNANKIKVNSFRDKMANKVVLQGDYTSLIKKKYNNRQELIRKRTEEQEREASVIAKQNQLNREAILSEHLARSMRLCEPFLDDREEPELPQLTSEMLQEINAAWSPRSPDEILVNNFSLSIKRRDIHTLADLNWLNDEIINFYMNLLIERGKQDKFPNVHAMSTFFYPKLIQSGYASLKRWTKKVDIFAQDLIVVPVHLGIHWCMSIIDFRDKSIRYYDSMGGSNTKCLSVLRQYLEDESLDKKKKTYDTRNWKLECVKKIPQQMNGSDCGVFSCMFAEYITANKQINFTQDDMPYFRCKMVYEILQSKLL